MASHRIGLRPIGFLPDRTLDEQPTDIADRSDPRRSHRPQPGRMRSALAAVLVLAAASNGFTGIAERFRVMTGQNTTENSARHTSYDLRKSV